MWEAIIWDTLRLVAKMRVLTTQLNTTFFVLVARLLRLWCSLDKEGG